MEDVAPERLQYNIAPVYKQDDQLTAAVIVLST
jgi:hypothetical protein